MKETSNVIWSIKSALSSVVTYTAAAPCVLVLANVAVVTAAATDDSIRRCVMLVILTMVYANPKMPRWLSRADVMHVVRGGGVSRTLNTLVCLFVGPLKQVLYLISE